MADNPQPTKAAMTPEKIEQGRKLLQELSDATASHRAMASTFPAPRPIEQALVLRRLERAEDAASSFAMSNAPALLAAAELGMAWEEEAKAARPFISMERIKVWSDAEGLPGLAQHNRYMAARAATDQLTGRIGS